MTIFELAIVLTLLIAASSIGIPAYFARPSVTLDNAARLLVQDLRGVQDRAILYGEPLEVRFADDGTGYHVTDAFGEPILSPYGDGDYVRDYPFDAVFRGVRIDEVDANGESIARVDENGRPTQSLRVVLGYRGKTRTVVMREGTGLLVVDGVDDGAGLQVD